MVRLLVCAFLACLSLPAVADTVTGRARVSDGDSLRIGGDRIRLFGIDAPELDQDCADAAGRDWACGAWARGRLALLAEGRRVVCTVQDRDAYDRLVAICKVNGADIGRAMVAQGAAVAYTRYSTRYVADQRAAARDGLGLWGGGFERPEDHRRAGEAARAGPDTGPNGCAIKGNISGSGRKLYHLPGGRGHADTRIDTARGERWFCTEAEARAAGWQPAR